MNLKFSILAVLSASFLLGSAEFVSPEAALDRVRENGILAKMPSRDSRQFHFVRSVKFPGEKSSSQAIYLFRDDCGRIGDSSSFIFTPSDDRFPAVLGYGSAPLQDISELPDNLKAWLEDYASQMNRVVSADDQDPLSYITKYRKPVEPLVESHWDQLDPYWSLCPLSASGSQCLTGCVATAMAQIMYYHKWPKMGSGSYSYSGTGGELSFDFENTTFDWDNMLPVYKDVEATDEQREAVARLMLACGISVNMNYSPTASGAYSKMVSDAMKDFFRYGPGTSNVTRISYSESEWENIIYREIEEGRPVLYSGAGAGGGHAFVCDGYDKDGYFHFNWGWSGAYDGYFRLAALNPRGTGAGGGTGNYNNYQDAVIGIARPDEPTIEPYPSIYCTGGFSMENTYSAEGDYYEVIFKFPGEGWIVNGSRHRIPGRLGVALVHDTETVAFCEGPDCSFGPLLSDGTLPGYQRFSAMIPRTGLEPGRYLLFPAFCPEDGKWIRPRVQNGQMQFVVMNVTEDGKIRFSTRVDEQTPEMEVDVVQDIFGTPEGAEAEDQIITDDNKRKFLFSAINRDIPYEGLVGVYLRRTDNDEPRLVTTLEYSENPFSIEDIEVEMPNEVEEGDYLMSFRNYYGYTISPEFRISVGLPTGVEEIGNDFGGANRTEYYTVDGRRIQNTEGFRGILIERGPKGSRKLAL